MDTLSTLSFLLGSSWLSGLSAYATVGFLGLFGRFHWIELPQGLHVLTHPAVFITALALYLLEFVADKIPTIDTIWDSIQTFIRIPVGAILAFASVGSVSPELKILATLLGGSLAFSAHAAKSTLRAGVNLSPEPFSNWILSFLQDLFVVFCLWVVLKHPYLMLALIFLFLLFFIWFIPKIFRTFRWMMKKFIGIFRSKRAASC